MIQRHPKTNYPRRNITLWQLSTSPHQRLRSPACSGSTMKPEWWIWLARAAGWFSASSWSSVCTTSSSGCSNSFWGLSCLQSCSHYMTAAARRSLKRESLPPGRLASRSVDAKMSWPHMLWIRMTSTTRQLWRLHMEMTRWERLIPSKQSCRQSCESFPWRTSV